MFQDALPKAPTRTRAWKAPPLLPKIWAATVAADASAEHRGPRRASTGGLSLAPLQPLVMPPEALPEGWGMVPAGTTKTDRVQLLSLRHLVCVVCRWACRSADIQPTAVLPTHMLREPNGEHRATPLRCCPPAGVAGKTHGQSQRYVCRGWPTSYHRKPLPSPNASPSKRDDPAHCPVAPA